jgi:hypothetical protein
MSETAWRQVSQLSSRGRSHWHTHGGHRVPECRPSVLPRAIAGGLSQCRESFMLGFRSLSSDAVSLSGNLETTDIGHQTDGKV